MSVLDNLYISLNVVFPMFIMMLIGGYAKHKKIVTEESLTVMNALVFRVFLSALVFMNIVKMEKEDIASIENLKLMVIILGLIVATGIITIIIFEKCKIDKKKIPVMAQGSYRSNLALFGIPMALSLYGESGLGVVALINLIAVPFSNGMGVVILESYATGNIQIKKILKSICKNPIIFWSFVALVLVFLDVPMPKMITSPLNSLGNVATPLSFVVLGATLDLKKVSKNIKYSVVVNGIKLIIMPFFGVLLGIKFGFTNEYLLGILGATGAPNAVSTFIMVKEIGGDENLAAELIVTSTIFSIITLFGWILILKTLGYL